MTNNELLHTLSDMFTRQLTGLNVKIDALDSKMIHFESNMDEIKNNVANLQSDMKDVKNNVANLQSDMEDVKNNVANLQSDMEDVKNNMANLQSDMEDVKNNVANLQSDMEKAKDNIILLQSKVANIELSLENHVVPRLQNIESCYTTTYHRYQNSIDEYEAMQNDINLLKVVVKEHSEKLQHVS